MTEMRPADSPFRRYRWLLLTLPILVGAGGIAVHAVRPPSGSRAVKREVAPRGPLTAGERAIIELFKSASRSTVFITTSTFQRDLFSFNVMEMPRGTGSGLVWDTRGNIVTNFHVIEGAQRAQVTLADHSTWDASLVGAEPDKDLAVLRIEAPESRLEPIPIGSSHDLVVGQHVFAIGNPFGLDSTLTTGIISALGRQINAITGRPIEDVIQTDAAINPGNSGGPLLDSSGRLIGVNTAIYSPSGASAGIGFAVPVDTVNEIVPQLIAYGKVIRPGLGIRADDRLSERFGVKGVLVVAVVPGGAADRAGLQGMGRDRFGRLVLGDAIVAVDGRAVEGLRDLGRELDSRQVGDEVEVTVRRANGTRATLRVRLQALD